MYLLDTNVVSELRRPRPHGAVMAWMSSVPAHELTISAVTVGEIQAGIEIARLQNAAKASELERWLDKIVGAFDVLAMDAAIFRQWARLMHQRAGELSLDAMIAATAITHNLTVATRNESDFEHFGVRIFNPFVGPH